MIEKTNYTVAIYARVSTRDRQEAKNQLLELRAFCKRAGWPVYKEYVDKVSGGTDNRNAFQRLFTDGHQRKFDLVLFWSLDRFSREGVLKTLTHLNRLDESGVSFKSYTEPYLDSAGAFRDAILAILASLAKQERIRLSERVKAGMDRAKVEGRLIHRPGLSPKLVAQIRSLGKENVPKKEIARRVKVSPATVRKYLSA